MHEAEDKQLAQPWTSSVAIADNSSAAHLDEEVMHATNEVNSCDLYHFEEIMFIVNELESLFACHWQVESKFRTNFEHLRVLCYA